MEKTAMQQLIEKLENFVKELDEKFDGDPLVKKGVLISISEAKAKLPVERQQIEDAAVYALNCGDDISTQTAKSIASDYFTQKYGQ